MTSEASDLLHAALALPTGDRAGVADALLASLDDSADNDADVETAWVTELQNRADRVISGQSAGIPWDQLRTDLTSRLAPE